VRHYGALGFGASRSRICERRIGMITARWKEAPMMAQRHGRGGGRGSGGSRAGSGSQGRGRPPVQRERPVGPQPNRARVREVIEPVVNAAGYDLDGLSLSRAGRRHLVRLTVDRDGGVNLDAVADVSRLVSAALDAVEADGEVLFAGEYELQVSSPGVDRPLTLPRHWRRNVGRLVQVRAGDKQLTGRIMKADDDGVVLSADGTEHELPYAELGTGKVQLEFTRAEAISDDDLAPIDGAEDYDDEDADDDFEEDEE
jgi:ribosome maturation factor RimP